MSYVYYPKTKLSKSDFLTFVKSERSLFVDPFTYHPIITVVRDGEPVYVVIDDDCNVKCIELHWKLEEGESNRNVKIISDLTTTDFILDKNSDSNFIETDYDVLLNSIETPNVSIPLEGTDFESWWSSYGRWIEEEMDFLIGSKKFSYLEKIDKLKDILFELHIGSKIKFLSSNKVDMELIVTPH